MALPLRVLGPLAWRNLWRNHRRTLIMLAAISVGAWAMIFMTALMRGMVDEMITGGIDQLPGHVQVHQANYRDDPSIGNSLDQPAGAFAAALDTPPALASTSRLKVPAMISSERASRGVTMLGVEPAGEIALGFDPDSVVAGRFLTDAQDDGLVVGRELLSKLETDLGKRVVIMSQTPDNDIADRGFRVVGVFEARLPSLEERQVYTGRAALQSMLGTPGRVSEVAVRSDDYRDVTALLSSIGAVAPEGSEVLSWPELDPYLGMMMRVMDGFVLVWILVIFLALSFGLVNTLMMAVFERIREIGLMLALGLRPSAIVTLVLLESLFLLTLGLILGNAFAIASVLPIADGIDLTAVAQGMEMMGAGAVLQPALKVRDLVLANAVVITLGLLTSLLPAWRAARYRPVEAITKT